MQQPNSPTQSQKNQDQMEVRRQTAKTLVSRLTSNSDQARTAALCELRLLSKSDPDIRPIIAAEGAIPFLTETLYSASSLSQNSAAASLLNLSISARDSVVSSPGVLDALSHVLRHHSSSPNAAGSAAATLYSLLVDESYRKIVGSRHDILESLIDIVRGPNCPIRSVKDALNALFGVALYPPNRGSLIDLGVVPPLFSLLAEGGRAEVLEDAVAVIGMVAGCEAAPEAFRRVFGVGVLVDLIDPATGASRRVREDAVSGLLNLAKFSGDGLKDEIRVIGGEGRVLDAVMDMVERGSPKGKNKADALIRALSIGDGGGVYGVNRWSRGSSDRASDSLTVNSYA